jgi:hypothetical protein
MQKEKKSISCEVMLCITNAPTRFTMLFLSCCTESNRFNYPTIIEASHPFIHSLIHKRDAIFLLQAATAASASAAAKKK